MPLHKTKTRHRRYAKLTRLHQLPPRFLFNAVFMKRAWRPWRSSCWPCMSLTFARPSNTTRYGKLLNTGRQCQPSSQLYLRRFVMAFEVPPLPYDYNALEPYIDTQTMQLHHDKHHAAYVNNLNNAVNNTDLANKNVDDILRHI